VKRNSWPFLAWWALVVLTVAAAVLLASAWLQNRQDLEVASRLLSDASGHWAEQIVLAKDTHHGSLGRLAKEIAAVLVNLATDPDSRADRDALSGHIARHFDDSACGWRLDGQGGTRLAAVYIHASLPYSCRFEDWRQGYFLTAAVPEARLNLGVMIDASVLLRPLVATSPTKVRAYLTRSTADRLELVATWPQLEAAFPAITALGAVQPSSITVPGTGWELTLDSGSVGLPAWWLPSSALLLFAFVGLSVFAVYRGTAESRLSHRVTQQADECRLRLQALLDNSNALIGIKDRSGRYLLVNRAFEEYLGMAAGQVVGRRDQELFAPECAAALEQGDAEFWQHQNAWCSEERLVYRGLENVFRWVRFPIPAADDSVSALACSATDITADQRTAAALRDSEIRYHAIFDQASDGILLVNPVSGALTNFNTSAHTFLGYTSAEFQGLQFSDLERPEDGGTTLLGRQLEAAARWSYETRFSTRSGELRHVLVNANIIDINGERQVLAFVRDISERKRTELSLTMFSGALDQSGSAVVITDRRDRIEYVNRRLCEMTGYEANDVLGHPAKILRSPETPESLIAEIRDAGKQGHEWRGELLNRRKSGERYWALVSIAPVKNERGEVTHFVAVGDDVTEIKETQFQMERLAFYDTLTGLANRQLFRERLEQALRVADRTHRPSALLYLDLDRFKRVNDTLGHDAGDGLLNAIGERLGKCVRKEDSVARLGGDEFTVLLAEVDGPSGAAVVARKILDALSESVRVASQEVFVSASVGITMIPQDGMDPAVLLKNADLAMYRAKDQGRNNYQFFRKEMNDEAAERLTLENDLRRAMYRDELELHYQPVTAEAGGGVVALEALLRWHHPQRGMVGPEVFISVAEESGLLVPMGQWVLRKACSEVKALQDAGYDDLGVCVNLSARQFRDPNLVGSVQATLTGTGLEARYLHLEITEPMLMDNLEDAIATVWQLKELGAAVSIDDFGAGYSSLRYLKRLPVDRLKVDRTFVSDIPWDEDAKAITAAVIAMAHKLQLSVVAEGVETQAQLEFLKDNHCDFFQGHLFSPPLPVEEVRTYLRLSS